jgi:hypothetical protein
MLKMALYSCNFGNYRNEFKNLYNVVLDKNIDYYLFTDKKLTHMDLIKLQGWNIIFMKLMPPDDVMDSFRWTAKYVKFVLPDVLKKYDIVIWVDNKRFLPNDKMNVISYDQVNNIINRYPESDVFNLKHQIRTTIQEEIKETIKLNLENKFSGKQFLDYLKDYKSAFDLVDTCVIIRKNNPIVNNAFDECLRFMKISKLKRDQNMYNYVLDNKNIKPVLLNYRNMNFL